MRFMKSMMAAMLAMFLMVGGFAASATDIQYPWMDNGVGDLKSDQYMDNVVGYDFTPQVDGEIIQLGAYVNATRAIRLYDWDTGAILIETQITANNSWVYVDISPIAVVAGHRYTVAVVGNNMGGGTWQSGSNFPFFPETYGDITIEAAVSGFGDTWPLEDKPGTMYGLVDIAFFHGSIGTGPVIGVDPTALSYSATAGGTNPASQDISISNLGDGALDWSASNDSSWLMISPLSGTAPSTLTATVETAGLIAGVYSDTIVITDVNDANSSLSIPVSLTVLSDTVTIQTPWRTNEGGSSLTTDLRWGNYTMGYKFIPQVNGHIIHLAGFYNGKKKVRLYRTDTAEILAQTTLSSKNYWVFNDITPVPLTAGVSYTIAIVRAGSGGSFRTGPGFPALPQTYNNITIISSVYDNGNGMPVTEVQGAMYGMTDIGFLPD